jgi:hypothetical protein
MKGYTHIIPVQPDCPECGARKWDHAVLSDAQGAIGHQFTCRDCHVVFIVLVNGDLLKDGSKYVNPHLPVAYFQGAIDEG